MSIDNPRGFIEHRHMGGHVSPVARMRRVKADGDSGEFQKFAGDPVILVSGNSVRRVNTLVSASAGVAPILGIIRAVYSDSTYPGIRPLTHSLPSGGNFLAASTAGWVMVNEDPDQTYIVSTDATVVSTLIGQFVDASAAAPNTAAGRSGFIIKVSTGTNTAKSTFSAAMTPFQVVEIAPNNLDGIIGGENNQDVEVIIRNHAWRHPYKIR